MGVVVVAVVVVVVVVSKDQKIFSVKTNKQVSSDDSLHILPDWHSPGLSQYV